MKYNFASKHQMKNVQRLAVSLLIVASLFTVAMPIAEASHGATVDFNAGDYPYDTLPVITVADPSAAGFGTVPVIVTSTIDSVGATLTLTETGPGTGIFDNSATPGPLFMNGNNKFPLETTITVSLDDPLSAGLGTVTVPILTSSGIGDTTIDLIETEPSTGIFEGIITFSATGPSTGPVSPVTVEITAGQTFSILSPCGEPVSGQITPIPAGSTIGVVRADIGNTITVTYDDSPTDITDTATISAAGGCGGGGGGLIISPVIQALASVGGGSSRDRNPPALSFNKLQITSLPIFGDILDSILNADPYTPLMALVDPQFDPPLIIENNAFIIPQYANTIPTVIQETGDPMQLTLNLFDQTGIEHIALYTNLRGNAREIPDSNTYIIYDEGKPLEIVDPEGFFSNVNFTEYENGTKYKAVYDITFAKPMNVSDIIIRTWDDLRNSGDIKIFDAIKIVGKSLVNSGLANSFNTETAKMSVPYYKFPEYKIPIADPDGTISYYNTFGGLEEKQVNPYYAPTKYPDYVGLAERHDDRFQQAIDQENIKAQKIAQELISSPFVALEDRQEHKKFFYPSNVGKLDREKENTIKDIMTKENVKATKTHNKLYRTNHLED